MSKRVVIVLALGVAGVPLWRRLRPLALNLTGLDRPDGRRASTRQANGDLRTRDELYREAKALGIPGRSRMTKAQLALAVQARAERR